jgi:hypothetical protein
MSAKTEFKMIDDAHAKAVITAAMASQAMDETQSYLERGRSLESTSETALKDIWETRFKAAFKSRRPDDFESLDDASAELRLRNIEAPFDRVQVELEDAQEEIRQRGPKSMGIGKTLMEFLEKLDGEKH